MTHLGLAIGPAQRKLRAFFTHFRKARREFVPACLRANCSVSLALIPSRKAKTPGVARFMISSNDRDTFSSSLPASIGNAPPEMCEKLGYGALWLAEMAGRKS